VTTEMLGFGGKEKGNLQLSPENVVNFCHLCHMLPVLLTSEYWVNRVLSKVMWCLLSENQCSLVWRGRIETGQFEAEESNW